MANTQDIGAGDIERPIVEPIETPIFGSDLVASALRDTGIPFIALTPGASFRGLHDSIVNFLGNESPQMLVCLHEEHAVAIAHGFAKVTGTPLAAAVHSNVGLMHATMAMFNAWCDRVPMVVIGATGPVDAEKRRHWIDWIHTARDQGGLVRSYVKWDDQPASAAAARLSLWRATWLSQTAPCAPVYINLDVEMQEAKLSEGDRPLSPARYMPVTVARPGEDDLALLEERISAASNPLFLLGRGGRGADAWLARQRVAEHFGAAVLTDLKTAAAFPTAHPLHVCPPSVFLSPDAEKAIRDADLIVAFDWVDLAGALSVAWRGAEARQEVINITLDHQLHNGWSMDHQALAPVDHLVAADPDAVMLALASRLRRGVAPKSLSRPPAAPIPADKPDANGIAIALRSLCTDRAVSLLHLPISWDAALWPFDHPLDYIGSEGGGGIGAGPGVSVGAALALRGSGRLPVAISGDGDFVMGVTALWTATHYRIPLLYIVVNNKSFFNDEVHQERVARSRQRPVENKWIGQRLDDPELSITQFATAQGAAAFGPVTDNADLIEALEQAIAVIDHGGVAVVDVRVPGGYLPAMASAMTDAKA